VDETSDSDASERRLSLNSGPNGLVPTTKRSTGRQVQSVNLSGRKSLLSFHPYFARWYSQTLPRIHTLTFIPPLRSLWNQSASISTFLKFTRELHPVRTHYSQLVSIADSSKDPAVYPDLELYRPVAAEVKIANPKTMLTPEYPRIHTCTSYRGFGDFANSVFLDSAAYPWFEIYPGHVSAGENSVATSRVVSLPQLPYPQFDLCKITISSCHPLSLIP